MGSDPPPTTRPHQGPLNDRKERTMNSVTMLMLSRAVEAERRREIERRQHRFIEPEAGSTQERRFDGFRWIRFPKLASGRA